MLPDRPNPIPSDTYRRRIAGVQQGLAEAGLEALLVLEYSNVVYLTGFHHASNERPIGLYLPAVGDPTLCVPLLEREHAEAAWAGALAVYEEFPGNPHPVVWLASRMGVKRLACDTLELRVAAELAGAGVAVAPSDRVERLRWIKDADELGLIRAAARFADRCLEHVLATAGGIARSGGSELDILEAALAGTRADMAAVLGDAFAGTPTRVVGTVHAGPQAALPHGRPGERRLLPGEVLIAGIGVAVGGYHAESGATFTFGEPSVSQLHCLSAAEACDRAAREACRVGAAGEAVNAAGWAVLREAGLGDHIRHRLGHGMGLQGHESPWLAPGGATVIEAGMVFSNEPGIYRPGVDGYRTINSMIVTPDGVEVPSRFQSEVPIAARILT